MASTSGIHARIDVDAVAVAHPEPLLRDRRHGVAVAFDLVLVVHEVAMRLEIRSTVDVDLEPPADSDELLADGRLARRPVRSSWRRGRSACAP